MNGVIWGKWTADGNCIGEIIVDDGGMKCGSLNEYGFEE